MRVHPSFLCSCKRLIGRHDRTAIIDRSQYRMEETSFREAVSDKEAQPTLIQTRLCSRHRKKAVSLRLINRQVRFKRPPRAKKAIGLASASGGVELPSDRRSQRSKR